MLTNLGCRDDLSASSFTFGSSFDNTRKIQDLDFGTAIFKYTRDCRQGCKGISCDFAPGFRNF